MIARRAPALAALVALLVVLPTSSARAAGTGQITSPAAGATLTSPTALVVEVTGRGGTFFDPRDHVVDLRLAGPSGAAPYGDTRVVGMDCRDDCDGDSTWTAGTFDPATLAPFRSAPSCNGTYTPQVRVDDGAWNGHAIRIARAPAAPTGVAASGGAERAQLTWTGAADPDVAGYRVQRQDGSGNWRTVADLGPDARAWTDDAVDDGEVTYRVATLKGDGLVAGAPAAPCADTEPDLATASAPVTTEVGAPATDDPSDPDASPSPSSTAGDTGDTGDTGEPDGGQATAADTGDGTRQADADGDGGSDDPEGTDPASGDTADAPRRDAGQRVAPPPAMGTGPGPDVGVDEPTSPDPQVAEPQDDGDDQAFSRELDFGELGMVEAAPQTETRTVRIPGALQAVLGEQLDVRRIAVPAAGGLLMLAVGLHLRRWTREGVDT